MSQPLPTPPERPRKRWTKHEYNNLVERGFFAGEKIYLYRGELIEMSATGTLQACGTVQLNVWLFHNFDSNHAIRCRCPFEVPGDSMPEPEFAVVTPEQEKRRPHLNAAVLLVEVADSSVDLDQEMAFDYAAAPVPEYWIVNMRDRGIEVYREPVADAAAPVGYRYQSHRIYREGESVSPLAKPESSVAVATLLTVD